MSFSTKVMKDITLIKIEAQRATVELAGEFKEELLKHIENGNIKVVVDMSQTDFLDSSFLGVLVTGLKRTSTKGGDLKIVGLQPPVHAMFELTRLCRIFDIFDTTEEALKSF